MSEIAENTKSGKTPEAKTAGDKLEPHVAQQQLGAQGKPEPTKGDASRSNERPGGAAIDSHVSQQQLGQPDALKIVRDAKKTGTGAGALAKVELVGAESPTKAPPKAEEPRLSPKELEKIAEAIDKAANGGLLGIGTDKDAINEQLKRVKNQQDRDALDKIYRSKVGHGIEDELKDELSGSDLDKALALWKPTNIDAARVSVALTEHKEWGLSARSNATVERDLRDTVSTMNSKQIEDMDRAYRAEHGGQSVKDALLNDPDLPASTKQALEIYLKVTDRRTDADTAKLAEIALKERNLDMFQEAFRDASPQARQAFLAGNGQERVLKAFGSIATTAGMDYGTASDITYLENNNTRQALDYVNKGRLDAATKVEANSGTINDNEEAIELAIERMTDDERRSYLAGKNLANSAPTSLTDQQKTDKAYYERLHKALTGAGNEREVSKWEDLIYAKDGTLVSQLSKHGGIIDDGMGDVLRTIEDMSEEDWTRLKNDPEQLRRIRQVLQVDLSESEMARVDKLLEAKIDATSYDASKQARRSIEQAMADNVGFWNTSEEGVLESIKRMSNDDKEKYRKDPAFKTKVDELIKSGMDEGAEQKSAFALLDAIARGADPEKDILSKLYVHADHINTDETRVIEDLEEAFKNDPKLRERLQTDPEYRKKFDEALHGALDHDEYERYAKPLIEQGHLPFKLKVELYQGVFNDDEKALYDAISKGSAADFQEIITNPQAVLPFLSDEERRVAVAIAQQNGEMRPEDKIRAAMLGGGTAEEVIHETLKGLKPEQIEQVRAEYLRKYDSDLLGDALDEMGGSDREKLVNKAGVQPQNAREAFNSARDSVYKSVDGVGRAFVDSLDGTAAMTMDELNQFSSGMSKYAKRFEEMPIEERTQFKESLLKARELYAKSESSAADTLVDGAIIAAGVAGAKFTGGVSLSLLAYTSLGGALFKIGTKAAIMGNDYDMASADVLTDGATGAIDATTIFMGPAQAAQFMKLGARSAETATSTILAQADDVLKASGRQMIKEGAEDKLQQRLYEEVAFAISNGAESVDQKVFTKVAKEFAATPDDVPGLAALLEENLGKAVAQEGADALKAQLRELSLNTLAGNVGGGLSGFVYGLKDVDESRSVKDNFYQLAQSSFTGGLTGAGMAAGFTAGIRGLGRTLKTVSSFRHVQPPEAARAPRSDVADGKTMSGGGAAVVGETSRVAGHTAQPIDGTAHGTTGHAPPQGTDGGGRHVRAEAGRTVQENTSDAASQSGSQIGDSAGRQSLGSDGVEGRRTFMAGEQVMVRGEQVTLAGYDTQTGEAILRHPDRADWAVRMEPFDNSDGHYKPITIDGEQYYRNDRGQVFGVLHTHEGAGRIYSKHEYQIVPEEELKPAPKPKTDHAEPVRQSDTRGGDGSLPAGETRRVEAPSVPKAAVHHDRNRYHATDLYDGAVLTLNGKMLEGRQLSPDGAPIEVGRRALGLDYKGPHSLVSSNHASIQFDAQQQMYYLEEHSLNGTYLKRAGENDFVHLPGGKEQPYRVYLGPNDTIRLGSSDGPEVKLSVRNGEHLKPPAGPKGDVDVRVFFDGRPLELNAEGEYIIGRKHQSFGNDSPGDILNRRVANNHAKLKWNESAQQWELTDLTQRSGEGDPEAIDRTVMVRAGGNGTYVKRADGKVSFIHGSSTLLGPNDRIHLGSPDGPELKFITNQGFRQPDGRVLIPRKNFDQAMKRPDGTTEISNFLDFRRLEDPYGRVLQTLDPEGRRIGFTYGADNRVSTIRFDDESVALRGDDGKWLRATPDGKRELYWDGEIDVEPDGAIRFTDRGRPPMSTIERVDGVREVHHPSGRIEYKNVSFPDELSRMNLIRKSFPDEAQARRFKLMMNKFEERARDIGLSPEEKAQTFFHVRRLFTAEYGAFLTAPERARLTEQIFDMASDPRVCQGYNNTCNVSTVEARMFARKPSEAARLISDVVINGKYVTADGVTVDLARIPGVLSPDSESLALAKTFQANGSDLRIDGKRPYASQIFEVTAVNLKYARSNQFKAGAGEIVVYEKPGGPATSKTGEELVRYKVSPNGFLQREVLKDSPHITPSELTDIYNQIAGTQDRHFVLHGWIKGGKRSDGSFSVSSTEELRAQIEQLTKNGDGPGIITVHTGHEPWYTDSGAGRAGGSGGWHVVNVHAVRQDARTGKVVVDITNQWGFSTDHMGDRAIPIDQLFESMFEPPPRVAPPPKPQGEKKGWFRSLFGIDEPASTAASDRAIAGSPQFDASPRTGTTDGARPTSAVPVESLEAPGLQAQIVGDRDSKGALWTPNRHFDELEYEDRRYLFEMLHGRETPLTEPDFTDAFAREALPIFKDWKENYKPIFKEIKEAREVVLAHRDRYHELTQEVPGLHVGTINQTRELMNDYYQGQPENLRVINAYLDARDTNYRLLEKLDDALEPRRQQLEDLANRVVASFRNSDGSLVGIPHVKVELVSPEQMGSAVATYGDGVLRINKAELLNDRAVADLLGTVYHELVHNEQQTTIVRALADELKLGARPSDVDMNALRELYRERTGRDLAGNYARRVMELRSSNGTELELPETTRARAQALMEAFKLNQPVGQEWIELGNSFRRIQRELPRLEGRVDEKSVAARILMDLSSKKSGTLSAQRYFGTDAMPEELQDYAKRLARYMRGVDDDAWNGDVEAEARQVILRHMHRHLEEINDRRRTLYENYMQFHEYDAWLAGERVRRIAIANGATHRDSRNSLWDEIDWIQ